MAKRVLIVDDSPTEMKLIEDAVRPRNYQLSRAVDGEEAIDKATRERPELILLDVVLPKKNGFQVCRQLKTTEETKGIKIVMITSKGQETDRFWGLKQGADDYVTKPFKSEDLLAAIDRVSR